MAIDDDSSDLVLVGGYTPEMGGSARGITSYRLRWGPDGRPALEELGVLDLASPSYLLHHPARPWVFAVSESVPARASSLLLLPDGTMTMLSSVPTGGDGACHLALGPDGRHLVVADYGSGSVSSFGIDGTGRLQHRAVLALDGQGPVPDRQRGPHAHQVVWDGDDVLVANLGGDRVHRLRLGPDGQLSEDAPALELPAGSGPRHLVVSRDHLVVACELSGELWLARRSGTGWTGVGTVSSSSAPRDGALHPSALRVDGDQVFVANRGPGTIGAFRLDRSADALVPTSEVSAGGANPRDLVVSTRHLWVAEQTDHRLAVLERDGFETVLEVAVPSPACVVLLDSAGR